MTANAANRLIQHYVDNFRRLPWRSPPGGTPTDPYRVWLSEIMLQQTTVATVVPRFERFVARWPTIQALAQASDEEILSEWAGLGYYARARNLIACAREVARRGSFPRTAAGLRELPGVGDYTSAAIAAIAFGEAGIAIDTNVARVVGRYNGLENALHHSRAEIRKLAEAMMSTESPGDFVQAMMDLGATICRPRNPKCEKCPLKIGCVARSSTEPERFFARSPRALRPHRYGVAYWIERDGNIWLERRPPSGLLGGMAALPGNEWSDAQPVCKMLGSIRHVFTHFSLDLFIERRPHPIGDGWWHSLERLEEAGLPTLYRRAAELALASEPNT
ncbi:MAG TPA: A/G-specific adenine glycosylase, partial [Sphingomicrobium sp.]|nr:A/G-specific adenine glycosylase [Sphingomicrobium sp.]